MDGVDWVLVIMGAVVLVVTIWIRHTHTVRKRMLQAQRQEIARTAMATIMRARRVLIIAQAHSWAREIKLAHLERYREQYGDIAKTPEYRYVTEVQQLCGMDSCTILVCEGWDKGKPVGMIEDIRHRLEFLSHTANNVDIQYIGEEYYR